MAIVAGCSFCAVAEDASYPRSEMTSGGAFEAAIRTGSAHGILVGPEAVRLQGETHSREHTLIDVEKAESKEDGCQVLLMTLTQPNVPTRSGANAGDYIAKTKLTLCRDGKSPNVEVIGCTVGMKSCMPN